MSESKQKSDREVFDELLSRALFDTYMCIELVSSSEQMRALANESRLFPARFEQYHDALEAATLRDSRFNEACECINLVAEKDASKPFKKEDKLKLLNKARENIMQLLHDAGENPSLDLEFGIDCADLLSKKLGKLLDIVEEWEKCLGTGDVVESRVQLLLVDN
jgi:hypothetical protein